MDGNCITGFQTVEQLSARGIDPIHVPPDRGDDMIRNAGRHPVKGNNPGGAKHPLERGKVRLRQIHMPKDVAREIGLHPACMRVHRLDTYAQIGALDLVQAQLFP
jgi:hypothetical protein